MILPSLWIDQTSMCFAEIEPWVERKEKEEKRKKKRKRRRKRRKRKLNHMFEWMKYVCNINLDLIFSFIGLANSFACPFNKVGFKD